jgi:nitrile hydratase accessory protein
VSDPPRANGELVFAEPWESRAFGIALALQERGVLDYEEFRALVIRELEARPGPYYERWQAALERVLAGQGLVLPGELDARAAAFAHSLAHDHDH